MNYTGNINVKAETAWKIQHGPMPAVVVEKDTKIPSILDGAPKQDGYSVTMPDGNKTWVERKVFEEIFQVAVPAMDFGQAIAAVREGKRIARRGWNGKNQYVELATNISYKNWSGTIVNVDHSAIGSAALAFVGTSGVQLGWLASQADMLADDWYIADEPTRCFKADVAASEHACDCAGVNKEARCHE